MLSLLSVTCSIKAALFWDKSVYPITSKVFELLKNLHLAESLLLVFVVMCQYKKQCCTQHNKILLGTVNYAASSCFVRLVQHGIKLNTVNTK